MNKTEREELRRLLRGRFKMLKADVAAREAELTQALQRDVEEQFAAMDRAYDDAMYRLQLAVTEANRVANDVGRGLFGLDSWGTKTDKAMVSCQSMPKPGQRERREAMMRGMAEIERRVKTALRELDRQEYELLTELATSALESSEAKSFFARLPTVSELVPSYRLGEIGS